MNKKIKIGGKQYDRKGLFGLFPDLTKKERAQIMKIYTGLDLDPDQIEIEDIVKLKNKNDMNGFSREVVEPKGLNGFSRMNYKIDGYELNDHELNNYSLSGYQLNAPRMFSRRWFRRNAPMSYIGTALVGLVVVDLATGGKVREMVGLKKKGRKR